MPIIHTSIDLRHYGASQYDPNKFGTIRDRKWGTKPHGGLWTSPVDSTYGWGKWCKDNEFKARSLTCWFDVRFTGTVLVIDGEEDLNLLPWPNKSTNNALLKFSFDIGSPSFASLVLSEIDAIHLTVEGEQETRYTMPRNLYGWDCESVLVMNPASIAPIQYYKDYKKAHHEHTQKHMA